MKYCKEVVINLPLEKAIELFDSTENLYKWQPTLKKFEHVSGDPGKPGATSKMVYDERGKEMEMFETVITNDLPKEISFFYETDGVKNTVNNFFSEEDQNRTKWILESEFIFSGFMKLMGFFMRGAFPKETLKSMNLFKEFAENS